MTTGWPWLVYQHTNIVDKRQGTVLCFSFSFDNDGDDDKADADEDGECDEAVAADYKRLCKGFSLCIAYAANVGGIATLTGTPPNLVFAGQADLYGHEYKVVCLLFTTVLLILLVTLKKCF